MRQFVAGVVTTCVILCVVLFVVVEGGLLRTETEGRPSWLEQTLARQALNAYLDRHAPRVTNPLPVTDSVLLTGMRLFRNNCAGCHGDPRTGESPFGLAFFPPAPQFIEHGPARPEWQAFYIVRNGIRRTGMTAWHSIMPDDSIWHVVSFITHTDSLPPAIADRWRRK